MNKAERAKEIVLWALEVLDALKLPGVGPAKKAVEDAAKALEGREKQQRLARALEQADEDFQTEARRRGWHDAADAVLQLPVHDAPSFRKVLRAALEEGRGEEVAQAVEQALAYLRLPPSERAEAALLYARRVWARLWQEPAFREAVRDVLLRDHMELLQDVSARLDRLAETLPGRVADEQEQRARERAWKALKPAVLPRPETLTPETLLESLKAPYQLVDFTGTKPRALCEQVACSLGNLSPSENRAWVLWGPGGIGKTRTAVEVACTLQGQGWQAFFLPHASEVPDWPACLPIWSRPDRPTLLIVDYAEQRPAGELEALVRAVRDGAGDRKHPLALLFLMRANPQEPASAHVAAALAEAWIRYEGRKIPPIEEPAERQALFRTARSLFRKQLAPPDAPPEVDYDPQALPQTPLALLALAVLAASGHRVVRSRDEAAVLTDLWERWEQARWRRTLLAQGGAPLLETPEVWDEARERMEQALAAATLGRPFTAPEEVAAWWEEHFPFQARTARGERLDPCWLARRLTALFPVPEGDWRLPSIGPDPLADVALARYGAALGRLAAAALPSAEDIAGADAMARRLAEEAKGLVVVRWDQAGKLAALAWPARMVAEVLPRLSDAAAPGAGEAARTALEAADRWLKETLPALPSDVAAAWLKAWEGNLPQPDRTLLLRPFLADFFRLQADRLPENAPDRVAALGNLGLALGALGKRQEALEITQEVKEAYRRLAEQDPGRFRPLLALSLNNLGLHLSEVGRREEALRATQEAAGLYRQLAQENPQAFLPDLASSLNNLGNRLSEVGRREEALRATQEAVDIRRKLAQENPQAFLPDLASSLNNLGNTLSALGRREEALEAYEEAVRTLLPFFRAYPEAFRDWMQTMRNNYLDACRAAGRKPDPALVKLVEGQPGGAPKGNK